MADKKTPPPKPVPARDNAPLRESEKRDRVEKVDRVDPWPPPPPPKEKK